MTARAPSRRQRGIAAVEFALVAIFVLIPLLLGVWQLGNAISEYDTIVKAVRDGTRYLTLGEPGTRTAAARCLVTTGNVQVAPNGATACVGSPLLPGLATATITICEATNCAATHANVDLGGVRANLATITVTGYQYLSWVPSFLGDITFRPIGNTMRAPL